MEYYRVRHGWYRVSIERVEAEKITDKTITIRGSRSNLRSQSESYFPTFIEAKEHALRILRDDVERKSKAFDEAKDMMDLIAKISESDVKDAWVPQPLLPGEAIKFK